MVEVLSLSLCSLNISSLKYAVLLRRRDGTIIALERKDTVQTDRKLVPVPFIAGRPLELWHER